jgi:FkbM family methyltransferase
VSLLDRVMVEPELQATPPVLVDVGAAGGVHPGWRRIARYAIGVGFEPDAREAAPLDAAQRKFRRWIFCPGLAVPERPVDGTATLHLTKSPQCSSSLPPRIEALAEWSFADFFEVTERRHFPATTLVDALAAQGIAGVDWLKCDTQGLDLKLWQSLPEGWRSRVLAVEVEPGIIDAYEGEEKLGDVLAAFASEPFWLAELAVGRVSRGGPALLEKYLGAGAATWVRRLAPGSPAWANAHFLRDFSREPEPLNRRAHLLGWVWATLAGQHGAALTVADAGMLRFGGGLFAEMAGASVQRLRWAMVRGVPAMAWRRLARA